MSGSTSATRKIQVTFEMAEDTKLVSGDHISGMPSAVVGSENITIGPFDFAKLDKPALQAAINTRAADLAVVTQALGLASLQLDQALAHLASLS